MEFIRVSEMLSIMEQKGEDTLPIPFDFSFITLNIKAGTGGKRIAGKNCVLVGGAMSKGPAKNQDHYKNYTRNFRSVNNNEVRQFHPLLVEEFNGARVIL